MRKAKKDMVVSDVKSAAQIALEANPGWQLFEGDAVARFMAPADAMEPPEAVLPSTASLKGGAADALDEAPPTRTGVALLTDGRVLKRVITRDGAVLTESVIRI